MKRRREAEAKLKGDQVFKDHQHANLTEVQRARCRRDAQLCAALRHECPPRRALPRAAAAGTHFASEEVVCVIDDST